MAFFAEIIRMIVKMVIVVAFAGAGVVAGKKLKDKKTSK